MVVIVDRYTRYFVNESGGCAVCPVYIASFWAQKGNRIVLHCIQEQRRSEEALKTGVNITDTLNTSLI